jgi:TRAP-type C4-dicarboxylate transport system permease small subunit
MGIETAAWFTRFRGVVTTISRWFERIGMIGLVVMVLIALIDVIGSKAFNWPLPGSTEITGVVQVVAIAAGLAFSKIDGRHISMDLFVEKTKGRGRAAFGIFHSVMGLGLFAIAAWMTFEYGISQLRMGTGTFLLGIVVYPFSIFLSLCCVVMCLVLLTELITAVSRVSK